LFDPKQFQRLSSTNHRVTSDPVEEQNCIAFAAGDEIHFWWPITDFPGKLPPPYFWPKASDLELTVEAFMKAYHIVGFTKCETGDLEDGFEKIAIFAKDFGNKRPKEPTHAAIQSPTRNGKWRSKMGDDEDIEHDLSSVEGRLYGEVVCFMKRELSKKQEMKEKLKSRGIPSY
jgi:hypothetical protein